MQRGNHIKDTMAKGAMAAMLLAVATLTACGKGGDAAEAGKNVKPVAAPPIHITAAAARTMELQRSVHIPGSLAGLETATLSNRVTGTVSKIYVDLGDRVRPNQKLLEIEPERFQLSVQETEAALEQTLARLGLHEVPPVSFDINQTAPVRKAKSEFDNAKSKMDRATPLHDSHAMNDFEYLDIVSAFTSAESALETLRDDARALLAQARQNQTMIDMRRKDFRDSTIVAPDGTTPDGATIDSYVVTQRKVSAGEYLREGTALFTLIADGTLKLQARVPERYLGDVKKGALVRFHVESYPNEEFSGNIATLDPSVDPSSRTFLIEALVDNGKYGHRLRPGSFVPGELLTRKDADCLMVPQDAVASFVGVTKLFKLVGDHVKSVDVETGQETTVKDDAGHETTWVEITKAGRGGGGTAGNGLGGVLEPGDRVAVSELTHLVEGSAVIADNAAEPDAMAHNASRPEAAGR